MNIDKSRTNKIKAEKLNISGVNALGLGDINYSTLANTIDRIPSDSDDKIKEIQDLLKKLLEAIDRSDLSNEEKQESLKQVSAITEAAPNYQDKAMQKKAKQAVGFLKVIASGVEPASKLATGFYELLSAIYSFFV